MSSHKKSLTIAATVVSPEISFGKVPENLFQSFRKFSLEAIK